MAKAVEGRGRKEARGAGRRLALLRQDGLSVAKTARDSSQPEVKVERLPHAVGLPLPAYQTEGAAGLDLMAAIDAGKGVAIKSGRFAMLPTGLSLQIPPGYEGQVRPRSGLAAKHGLTVLNAPGTIDSDYRGEVMVLLVNLGAEKVRIRRGDRIAQLVIAPVTQATVIEADALQMSKRGTGGFGSTGKRTRAMATRTESRSKKSR